MYDVGDVGYFELLLLLFLAGVWVLLYLLAKGGRLRSFLLRFSEATAYRELRPEPRAQPTRPSWTVFPLALTVTAAVSGLHFAFFTWLISFHEPPRGFAGKTFVQAATEAGEPLAYLPVLCAVAAAQLMVFRGLYLHFQPIYDRRLKYECLLVFILAPALFQIELALSIVARFMGPPGAVHWAAAQLYLPLILLNPALLMILLGVLSKYWQASRAGIDGQLPSSALLHAHRFLRRTWIFLSILPIHPFGLLYLWARYFVIEDLSRRPILYLRAFRHSAGATAFGRIVSKATRPFGVVVAIVHTSQPGSTLLRDTSIADQARTTTVPDSVWQDWVLQKLRGASIVIIDTTMSTESLAWELEAARSSVDPHRILVLVEQGAESTNTSGLFTIHYALDERSARRARHEIQNWLRGVFIRLEPRA